MFLHFGESPLSISVTSGVIDMELINSQTTHAALSLQTSTPFHFIDLILQGLWVLLRLYNTCYSQNNWGWKGPLQMSGLNPCSKQSHLWSWIQLQRYSGLLRALSSPICASPRRDTPQLLSVPLPYANVEPPSLISFAHNWIRISFAATCVLCHLSFHCTTPRPALVSINI